MRMKVSDYIARKLVDEGISDVFMVTGGGAMHLDDGLGHEPGLHRRVPLRRNATPGSTIRSLRSA